MQVGHAQLVGIVRGKHRRQQGTSSTTLRMANPASTRPFNFLRMAVLLPQPGINEHIQHVRQQIEGHHTGSR